MPVAAVFDMDGTLVTFNFDVQGTRKAIFGELARRGYDTTGLDSVTPTQRILDSVKAQRGSDPDGAYESVRSSIFSILDRFETLSVKATAPFPGVRQTLQGLREKGVRLAVLTNSGRRAATEALGRPRLLDLFEFVLTRDDTAAMKPSPEGLTMAVARLGLPRESVFYVGDSLLDIQAARRAGVPLVSVATGNYTKDRLLREGSAVVISSLAELPGALGV